jgi:hypothetical protein
LLVAEKYEKSADQWSEDQQRDQVVLHSSVRV